MTYIAKTAVVADISIGVARGVLEGLEPPQYFSGGSRAPSILGLIPRCLVNKLLPKVLYCFALCQPPPPNTYASHTPMISEYDVFEQRPTSLYY